MLTHAVCAVHRRSMGVRPTQPIQALNPYNCAWTIRARVANKTPRRSYSRNGADQSVFSVELVDAQVTHAPAACWACLCICCTGNAGGC